MAIGTTSAGPGIPLSIPVIDLARCSAGVPGERDAVTYGEYGAWLTGQNDHGEADTPPSR